MRPSLIRAWRDVRVSFWQVINELIREYLEFNRACANHRLHTRYPNIHPRLTLCPGSVSVFGRTDYGHTLAVFAPEARLPQQALPRPYVAQQSHLHEANHNLPLLYNLLAPPTPPPAPPVAPAAPAAEEQEPLGCEPAFAQQQQQPAHETMAALASAPRRLRVPGPTPVIFTAGA